MMKNRVFTIPTMAVVTVDEKQADGDVKQIETLRTKFVQMPDHVDKTEQAEKYFKFAFTYHYLIFLRNRIDAYHEVLSSKSGKLTDKEKEKYETLSKVKHFIDLQWVYLGTDIASAYDDSDKALKVFASDRFAKLYAMVVSDTSKHFFIDANDNGEKVVKSTPLVIGGQSEIANAIRNLTADGMAIRKNSDEYTEFINVVKDNLSTNGGHYYKNIRPKFTVQEVHDELFAKSKKLSKHTKTGGFTNEKTSAFELAKESFILMLSHNGVTFGGFKKVAVVVATESANTSDKLEKLESPKPVEKSKSKKSK